MSVLDYVNNQKTATSSLAGTISKYKKQGKLGETVVFHKTEAPKIQEETETPKAGFLSKSLESVKAAGRGEIKFKDFIEQVPKTATRQAVNVANVIAPAISNFVKTTGSIFGEGIAYAIDKNVREQYKAGHLEVLPTITEMTPAKLAKYTVAAGLETAIFRSFPEAVKMKLAQRGGVGALQGLGFAVSTGLAQDKTPEDIVKDLPFYGVSGATLGVVFPYLLPLLNKEIKLFPKELKETVSKIETKIEESKKINPVSIGTNSTAVPISTPNTRYQSYLRSQGYEPYIPDNQLPSIEMGTVPKKKDILPTIQIGEKDVTIDLPPPPGTKLEKIKPKQVAPTRQTTVEKQIPKSTEIEPVKKKETFQGEEFTTEEIIPVKRVTKVPASQLPVGEGKTKVSRLEQRVQKTLADINETKLSSEKLATYQTMNKREQIIKDTKFVEDNVDDSWKILRGEKDIPQGNTYNGIALAMSKKAELEGDSALAIRLASLRATRSGQEISLLSEVEPDNVVSVIDDIIKARTQRLGRKVSKGGLLLPDAKEATSLANKEKTNLIKKGKEKMKLSQLKNDEVEKLLNDILC